MAACLMRSCTPYSYNRLAYPAGRAPGFDPTHVASQNISPGHGLSAVAVPGGNMLNLLKGRPCTINAGGTSFYAFNGSIGQSVTATTSIPPILTDSGNAAVVDLGQTLAGIIFNKTQAGNPVIVGSGNVFASAWYIYIDSATNQLTCYTSAARLSGLVLNNNEAYFVAVSNNNDTTINFIVKSLATGEVLTATTGGGGNLTSFTSSGTYSIINDTFNDLAQFPVAAVSYTPAYLSPSELLAWSADPWAFWYPRQPQMLVSTQVAAQYAAFSTPQHSLSQVVRRMVGY